MECRGKRRYSDIETVIKIITNAKKSKGKKPIRFYCCSKCGLFHLTSISIKDYQKKKSKK